MNTWEKELPDIIKNQEIKDLLLILGCGVGESFNMKNLRYDKVLLIGDADIDGAHIGCLLFAFFAYHLPELVKQGRVYFAQPPLFKVVKGKEHKYLQNDEELKEYRSWDVTRMKGLGEMMAEELWESTLDPATRHLIQAKPEDFESTLDIVGKTMGKKSSDKKEFILKHAKEFAAINDDTAFEVEAD